MRVNRDVRVRSDPLSSSFLFFIPSSSCTRYTRGCLKFWESPGEQAGWIVQGIAIIENDINYDVILIEIAHANLFKPPASVRWSSWKQAFFKLNPFPLMKQFVILLPSSLGAAGTWALMICLSLSPCQHLEWLCFFLFSPIRRSRWWSILFSHMQRYGLQPITYKMSCQAYWSNLKL